MDATIRIQGMPNTRTETLCRQTAEHQTALLIDMHSIESWLRALRLMTPFRSPKRRYFPLLPPHRVELDAFRIRQAARFQKLLIHARWGQQRCLGSLSSKSSFAGTRTEPSSTLPSSWPNWRIDCCPYGSDSSSLFPNPPSNPPATRCMPAKLDLILQSMETFVSATAV